MKNWLVLGLFFSGYTQAITTVMDADVLFEQQAYTEAKAAYEQNIEIGSPHAYYQLGYMHFKGLGIPQNIPLALIYFSLAAEYKISDSEQIAAKILDSLPEQQRLKQSHLIAKTIEKYGKKAQQAKYFPVTVNENLSKKLTLSSSVFDEDWFEQGFDDPSDSVESFSIEDSFSDSFSEDGEFTSSDFGSEPAQSTARPSSFINLNDRPYFAVLDYQIALDGSVRDLATSQKMGYVKKRVDDFARFYKSPVQLDQQPNWFVGQQILGIADMSRFELEAKHPNLYSRMRRIANKLRASDKTADQFQLAMALMRFKFLTKTPEEGAALLKQCAEKHWPAAQYEYGLYLYREQIDVAKGIEYIGLAAQHGYSQANFQLAALLQHSPWVEQDIPKALFWYARAAEQNISSAKLRAAYIHLIDNKQDYYNAELANQYLTELAEEKAADPEFHFVKALSYRDSNNRQLKLAFSHMRKAIDLADSLSWDTTEWENLFSTWSEGRITLQDDINNS